LDPVITDILHSNLPTGGITILTLPVVVEIQGSGKIQIWFGSLCDIVGKDGPGPTPRQPTRPPVTTRNFCTTVDITPPPHPSKIFKRVYTQYIHRHTSKRDTPTDVASGNLHYYEDDMSSQIILLSCSQTSINHLKIYFFENINFIKLRLLTFESAISTQLLVHQRMNANDFFTAK
jgi:hypothetical protein